MKYIVHRVNDLDELKKVEDKYGVEIDLRSDCSGNIYLSHDPFESGPMFETYLQMYKHQFLILNIKSERIEYKVKELLKKHNINTYFFLDSSFPMIYLLSNSEERNIAIRVSEYESLDVARNMKGKTSWIWLDCFKNFPIQKNEYDELKNMGYQICLVSPELQGREDDIEIYANHINTTQMIPDAICTKKHNIEKWIQLLS